MYFGVGAALQGPSDDRWSKLKYTFLTSIVTRNAALELSIQGYIAISEVIWTRYAFEYCFTWITALIPMRIDCVVQHSQIFEKSYFLW